MQTLASIPSRILLAAFKGGIVEIVYQLDKVGRCRAIATPELNRSEGYAPRIDLDKMYSVC
jgi:hypothetical protein